VEERGEGCPLIELTNGEIREKRMMTGCGKSFTLEDEQG